MSLLLSKLVKSSVSPSEVPASPIEPSCGQQDEALMRSAEGRSSRSDPPPADAGMYNNSTRSCLPSAGGVVTHSVYALRIPFGNRRITLFEFERRHHGLVFGSASINTVVHLGGHQPRESSCSSWWRTRMNFWDSQFFRDDGPRPPLLYGLFAGLRRWKSRFRFCWSVLTGSVVVFLVLMLLRAAVEILRTLLDAKDEMDRARSSFSLNRL